MQLLARSLDSSPPSPIACPNGLVLFTRYPEVGKTKTRLIPHLGAPKAAALQRRMTEHIVSNLQTWQSQSAAAFEVHFAGGTLSSMQRWLGTGLTYQCQTEGELGQRLQHVFRQGLQKFQRLVVIGADCPSITPNHLKTAFQLLQNHDVVIGPAHDGGYYLIGLSQVCPALFQSVPWGTAQVFEQTVVIARQRRLSLATLETLSDIDRPEDLSILPQPLAVL
ncbi:MAG: TIGR04282 family arsenosugar biosynthesis glycosyltransferase [Cyanobacteria bacterium P01_C01_bin.120]